MIAAMCEQFVARAAEPFRLDALWPLTERMERYGIAGFGWGVTWLGEDGELHEHRDTRAFRDDPAAAAPGATNRRLARPSTAVVLDGDGEPHLAHAGAAMAGARQATRGD
jgi:hypothetical protein